MAEGRKDENHVQDKQPCCGHFFHAHIIEGRTPMVVLECCSCGRLWHRREDGQLVPYDEKLLPVIWDSDEAKNP